MEYTGMSITLIHLDGAVIAILPGYNKSTDWFFCEFLDQHAGSRHAAESVVMRRATESLDRKLKTSLYSDNS